MPTYAGSRVAPPQAWDEFEDIVCSAAKNRWDNPNFTRHGRQGQKQDGVDIYGSDHNQELVGLQCKNTVGALNENIIKAEVEKAKKFDEKLTKLFIATTLDTDRNLQKSVRQISRAEEEKGGFEVHILFWHDIWHDLTLDERRVFQHYPNLKPANMATGMTDVTSATVGTTTEAAADSRKAAPRKHDVDLFEELLRVLPFEPTVRLIRDHDFGGAFHKRAIQPLFDFVETWDSPEREFIDAALQAKLTDLYQAASNLSGEVVTLTVPIGPKQELVSVYSDSVRAEGGPRPKWVIEDGRRLNAAARLFTPIYEEFIRFARQQLNP
jgi:hypothetical protein